MGIRTMKLASKLTERSEPQENAWASGDGGKENLQLACENIRFSSGEKKRLFSQATAFVVFNSFPNKEISWFHIQADAWKIDWSPQEKRKTLQWWINILFDKVESNECDFWWRRGLNRMQRLWSNTYVSAGFKEYCRSDSAYRLRYRLEGPHQLPSFTGLVFVRNCNILLLERTTVA